MLARLAELRGASPAEFDIYAPFADLGLKSREVVAMASELGNWLGRPVSPTLAYDYPTIDALAQFLGGVAAEDEEENAPTIEPSKFDTEPIAVIGMGCRFPGAAEPASFWRLLRGGVDAITKVPSGRWDDSSTPAPRSEAVKWGGFLSDVDLFDERFFGISPREARMMDPQQRLVLEVAWEALEAAGHAPHRLATSHTGVWLGLSTNDYALLRLEHHSAPDPYAATGNSHSIAANRLSYLLDLRGPSVAVDTACSSSLVAVHMACQSLRTGECELALAGGVNLMLSPVLTHSLNEAGMLSIDGRCKTFDARANGYVRGEGCGIVVLKRLSDATRDGDLILALVRGSAVNQDGGSNGLSAPNGLAQQAVIRRALANAGVAPGEIGYFEAHGTGTSLGDPIEFSALSSVLAERRAAQRTCFIGSVKTNIGHLEAAAGIAGFIKTVLSLYHGEIPPHLHLQNLNPQISMESTPFVIPTAVESWQEDAPERLAGVSSFGFGGTNAHVVLSKPPHTAPTKNDSERPSHIFTISAKTDTALRALAGRYTEFLSSCSDSSLADTCFTANTGRSHFAKRLAVVATSVSDLRQKLVAFVAGERSGVVSGQAGKNPRLAFVFGNELPFNVEQARLCYESFPAFRQAVSKCSGVAEAQLLQPLLTALNRDSVPTNDDAPTSQRVTLLTFQFALAELWRSWGIVPETVLSYGGGVYAAAVAAGSLGLAEAFALCAQRPVEVKLRELQTDMVCPHSGRLWPKATLPDLDFASISESDREINDDARRTLVEQRHDTIIVFGSDVAAQLNDTSSAVADEMQTFGRLPLLTDGDEDLEGLLDSLAHIYVKGFDVDWFGFDSGFARRRQILPTYPFERRRHWIEGEESMAESVKETEPQEVDRRAEILKHLVQTTATLLGTIPSEVDPQTPFLEMGADSIILLHAGHVIEDTYKVSISIRQLFEDLTTLDAIATYIVGQLPLTASVKAPVSNAVANVTTQTPMPSPHSSEHSPNGHAAAFAALTSHPTPNTQTNGAGGVATDRTSITNIIEQQLQIMAAQWNALQNSGSPTPAALSPSNGSADASNKASGETPSAPSSATVHRSAAAEIPSALPAFRMKERQAKSLSDSQQAWMDAFIARYNERTQSSKRLTQNSRNVLADNRTVAGLRLSTKELLYPIVAERSLGSKFWDVDGNEYIDLAMGFGVNLFGHAPAFIQNALQAQLAQGIQIGPQTPLAGKVASLICELTGMERVTFTNTGTESVMTALRLVRAATNRSKIVLFAGSYHGTSDAVLARASTSDETHAVPLSPGVTHNMVGDVMVLEYGAPRSLEIIKAHAHELAGVLVEPVQSRAPELQPREFLHQLRQITAENGVALIIDEVLTGFRNHPGGAQAFYGIKADVATYGKIIGGGLPIGVVAGSTQFMNYVDGGMWNYGDDSLPLDIETAFFSGTFCKHPLAMSAAVVVLEELKRQGAKLQEQLNRRTEQLAERLNALFEECGLPLRMVHFGSLFRFKYPGDIELLYYQLIYRGVYIWEARNCFLSTAHTDEDLDRIVEAFRASVAELQSAGFLPGQPPPTTLKPSGNGQPEPPEREQSVATTEAQKQLWLLAQTADASSLAYNESLILKLHGQLDIDLLRRSFRQVIERHEALRTGISPDGEWMKIAPKVAADCAFVDFSQQESTSKETHLARWLEDESRKPFELAQPPLIRAAILKTEAEQHLFVVTVHHLLVDGWSLGVVLQEVWDIYTAMLQGTPTRLPQPLQFRDYARWQEHYASSEKATSDEAYWVEHFRNHIPVVELPTDFPRPEVNTHRGARQSIKFDSGFSRDLKTFGQRNGCTLFMTLLTGYTLLIHRLSNQEEIVVGIPVAGRDLPGSDRLVGYCTNLLAIRSRCHAQQTLAEYMTELRGELLHGFEHQQYPFSVLVRKLNPARDTSRAPLVSVTFNLERAVAMPETQGLEITVQSPPINHAKFDLHLNFTEVNGELLCDLDYNPDLLNTETALRWLGHLETLLAAMTTQATGRVCDLPLHNEREQQQILVQWNDTAAAYPSEKPFHKLFEAQAAAAPDAVAVSLNQHSLTYDELNRQANQLARRLVDGGVRPDDCVGICLPRSLEMIVALLAIQKAGGAFVPLDPEHPPERLHYVLSNANMKAVLTSSLYAGMFSNHVGQTLCLDAESVSVRSYDEANLDVDVQPENLAYVMYTSGSTGQPKGVMVPHRGLVNYLAWAVSHYEVERGHGAPVYSTIGFDLTITSIFAPLLAGRTVVLLPENQEGVETLQSLMRIEGGLSLVKMTPAHLEVLAQDDSVEGLDGRTRVLIVGGDALRAESLARWRADAPRTRLINEYGPTETVVGCCVYELTPDDAAHGSVPIGRPIANTRLYVLDTNLRPTPIGVSGELYIGGDGVSRGYLRQPSMTAERFVPDPFGATPGARLYKSGDAARYRSDGLLEYVGRLDRQVKVRGFRVELGEIETALARHDDIAQAVVEAQRDGSGENRLVAYFVARDGQTPDAQTLREFVGEALPSYMIPSVFVSLPSMPLNANGKIDRRALPAPDGTRSMLEKPSVPPQTDAERIVAGIWREVLKLNDVGRDDNFFDLGGHSLLLMRVRNRLTEAFKRPVPVIELFRHPTVAALARMFESPDASRVASTLERNRPRRVKRDGDAGTAVAIIGMAGRFPGARNVHEFWRNLERGVESITFFSDDELEEAGVAGALLRDPQYVKAKAILEDVEQFDASLFGITPYEAALTDPQHRVFLECAWEALEDAGYDPERYAGLIGVYASSAMNTYLLFNIMPDQKLRETLDPRMVALTNDKDFLPTRVSYKLNLRGPSLNVQTACSSSLVGVHLACRSLSERECDIALAGGVAIHLPQKSGYLYQAEGIESPDGHCRAFDAKAQGTVFGNGAGVVALKRLVDAQRDGDFIYAVVKGSAVNNDGGRKLGYTAPAIEGQAKVIAEALSVAGVEPASIGFIEAHGTGTQLGDPVEIAALNEVFGEATTNGRCALGSVKTNVGHLDTAAGVVGLMKAALALQHRRIPPSLHFNSPNPQCDFARMRFEVNTEAREWTRGATPRRAGVSSFGIGGTNAHVVLEEAPPSEPTGDTRHMHLLALSAATESALDVATNRLVEHLRDAPQTDLSDVAYTLLAGRRFMNHRRILVCRTAQEAIEYLSTRDAQRVSSRVVSTRGRPVAFMFPGQGAQFPKMAREVYETEAEFRDTVDHCAKVLTPHAGFDLLPLLYPPDGSAPQESFDQTSLTQPALFVVEYALARLLISWGIRPQVMIGHSIGEYVAACLAGVFTLEEGLELVATRGRLMDAMPNGSMLAVSLPHDELQALLPQDVTIAAINSRSLCVVAGSSVSVERLEAQLSGRGVICRKLRTSHAFHSAMMNPMLESFRAEVGRVRLRPPQLPYFSNLTGKLITAQEATDPHYWSRHLRETVRFDEGLSALLANPEMALLEVGPGHTLAALARRHPQRGQERLILTTLEPPETNGTGKAAGAAQLINSFGQLWLSGAEIDVDGFYAGKRRRRLPLPTYPFERQRFWIEPPTQSHASAEFASPASTATVTPDIADWFYLPCWKPSLHSPEAPLPQADELGSNWLVFADDDGFGKQIAQQIEATCGRPPTLVMAGESFASIDKQTFALNPQRPEDYATLFTRLRELGQTPQRIVHLWSMSPSPQTESPRASFEHVQHRGLFSLLSIAQALTQNGVAEPTHIEVVTNNAQAVAPGERPRAEAATICGATTVIPQEYEHIACRSIDLSVSQFDERSRSTLTRQLMVEFLSPVTDPQLAYRGAARYVKGVQPVSLKKQSAGSTRLKSNGVYLITGGLGKIGLLLAHHLARTLKAKLVLTGRTELPARETWMEATSSAALPSSVKRCISQLMLLEKSGAEFMTASANAADAAAMRRVFAAAEERFGRLDGIFHCAGTTGEASVTFIDEGGTEAVGKHFDAKAHGLYVLEELLRERQTDFVLLFSSLSSVLGGLGFAHYSAANQFMDAFAHQQNVDGNTHWISVNWEAFEFDDEDSAHTSTPALTPDEGVEVFDRIMAGVVQGQVIVSKSNLDARLARWLKVGDKKTDAPTRGRVDADATTTNNVADTATLDDVERNVAEIWQEALGIQRVSPTSDFFALGGDSLVGLRVATKIRERFRIQLPVRQLFLAPTVAGLAATIKKAAGTGLETSMPPIGSLPQPARLPLSFAQLRLWTMDELNPGSVAFNLSNAFEIRGRLDSEALARSLDEIVQRHEVLRTNIVAVDGQPELIIHDDFKLSMAKVDLRHVPTPERRERANQLIAESSRQPFNLSQDMLFRVTLIQLEEQTYILLLITHHIINDGWSTGIFMRELETLYDAHTRGVMPALPDLPFQYADYAVWQRQHINGEKLERLSAYWRQQLADAPPVLNLRTDYPRHERAVEQKAIPFRFTSDLSVRLQQFAAAEHATLFMALLTTFQTMLHTLVESDDIVVGTNVADRNYPGTDDLIGFFINQFPLRTNLAGDPTFRAILGRVREVTLGAFDHQEMPFERLVALINPQRDEAVSPLFQVQLVMPNTPPAPLRLAELSIKELPRENGNDQLDLTLNAFVDEQGVHGFWEYNAAIFARATVLRLQKLFELLLQTGLDNPDARLSELKDALLDTDRQQQQEESDEIEAACALKLKDARRRVAVIVPEAI
jgi:amino acid adenylation domain-containing protein